MPQLERRSDRWISTALSVVLHGAIVGLLVYGWLSFRKETRAPPSLAIDATVVSSKAVSGSSTVSAPTPPRAPPHKAPAPPQAAPPPPAADESTVPPPSDMAARQEAARKAAQAAEQQAQAQADAERKMREEAQRKEQEEEQKVAQEQAAEKAKKLAEAKAAAEAKKRALAAEQQRRAEEAKALAMNQADLQQSVEAEEKAMAARSGPAMASWVDLVKARIQHAWIRPPSAREGIDCIVDVTQVPGGQVVNVKVGACNGDAAVIQSIQDATYRASPLPAPADPTLFERDFQLEFKPTD